MQRALIQYRDSKNYDLVREALIKVGREDLIGFDEKCLIPPRKMASPLRTKKNVKNGKERVADQKRVGNNNYGKNRKTTPGAAEIKTEKRKKKTIRNVHKKKTSGR